MFSEYKVGKWYFYFVAGPFVVTQIILSGSIIYLLLYPNWFESQTDNRVYYKYNDTYGYDEDFYFDGDSFIGGSRFCISGCGKAYYYHNISEIACGSLDYFDYPHNEIKTICNTFKQLELWGSYKTNFDFISLGPALIWILIVSCNLDHWIFFKSTYIFILGSAGTYIAGSLIFFMRGPITFSDCDSFPSNGEKLIICATIAPKITFIIMVIFLLLVLAFIITGCIAEINKMRLNKRESISSGKIKYFEKKSDSLDKVPEIRERNVVVRSKNKYIGEPDLKDRPIPQEMIDLCSGILAINLSIQIELKESLYI